MQKIERMLFSLQKILFGRDMNGNMVRYTEAIGYFTDLKSALREKRKHKDSFVFPFQCRFYRDRRAAKNIIRAVFH